MPRARNRAPSVEPAQAEAAEEMDLDTAQPLEFNEPLTWRVGKQIPVTDLLRRLKTLSTELESIEQEDAHRETLVPKAQELASPQLLGHKDKGVKAYVMLCIVDMFKLLAPDAPFKGSQLRDIFSLFTSTIVPALANPSDPYNAQHSAILMSFTGYKSIVLLTDIPGSDTLILDLFTNCFDVMSGVSRNGTGEKLPKNLEYHMTTMLCLLVDESASLPTGVVDIILAQFLRADPRAMSSGSKRGGDKAPQIIPELSPAYNMARSVCNNSADKMRRSIGQYFSSVLIDASETAAITKSGKPRGKKRTRDESEDEADDGLLTPPAEGGSFEVEKAHRLLRELWRSSPDVVQNVVAQVETEIEAESPQLRMVAVETIGDMVAGIGAAGAPMSTPLDPGAYPSQSLEDYSPKPQQENTLLDPIAPHAFASVYPSTYQRFMERYKDKAAQVRSAWAAEAGRIIITSGGGKGLDEDQEKALLECMSKLLVDIDERVRLAAVQAVGLFDFHTIVVKLGKSGGVATNGSLLCNLGDRIRDPKPHVRTAAMELLARMWGVAAAAIAEGNERVRELLGSIPSKIFEAMYTNNREINALVQRVLFESLLPLSYPPIKAKKGASQDSHRASESQLLAIEAQDPDGIRAERILVLISGLEDRAKTIFFKLQQRQAGLAPYIEKFLAACEDANGNKESKGNEEEEIDDEEIDEDEETGGRKGGNDKAATKNLDKLIGSLSTTCPDPIVAAEHLKKFAKQHDRRSYQLVRFCIDPASEYRKIFNAMRELRKRLEDGPSRNAAVSETLLPLVQSAAVLVYNRSHVPAIVDISRTDKKGLGAAAHDVLKEISTHMPDLFKIHVHELCQSLVTRTPSPDTPEDPAIVDTLKACAGFARRFPGGMPKDRDFFKAMVAFATRGTPPKAAKHAVTVITSSADKKEMYIKDIQKACIENFEYGEPGFLSKLAAISQLKLLANKQCEDLDDSILDIAIHQVLLQVKTPAEDSDPQWSSAPDSDIEAKLWALRILVNGLRGGRSGDDSEDAEGTTKEVANRVYKLLNTLIKEGGELSKSKSTPEHHKAQLRLAAAIQLLKLSRDRKLDHFLTPTDFNRLSTIAQDSIPEIRAGFVGALKKYLGNGSLPNRFYALVFIYAFEPTKDTLQSTVTWLKSRAALSAKLKDTVIEGSFARFLSLLAHHPDFSQKPGELEDFVEYIMFYLKNVATEANSPVLYHIAQRLKQVQDGIDPDKSENLYVLSDIAEAIIRQFAGLKGWSLQLTSGRILLPSGLFQKLPSHSVAQEIAGTKYIPEQLDEDLEDIVKNSLRPKKRKSDGTTSQASKKAKATTSNGETKKIAVRRAPKAIPKKAPKEPLPASERRKSNRATSAASKSYAEHDDSEDDEELEQWQAAEEDRDEIEVEEDSSTPPTSDPVPLPTSALKESAKKSKPAPKAVKKAPPKPLPTRSGRATRARKEKSIMDVPSDSE